MSYSTVSLGISWFRSYSPIWDRFPWPICNSYSVVCWVTEDEKVVGCPVARPGGEAGGMLTMGSFHVSAAVSVVLVDVATCQAPDEELLEVGTRCSLQGAHGAVPRRCVKRCHTRKSWWLVFYELWVAVCGVRTWLGLCKWCIYCKVHGCSCNRRGIVL